MFRFDFKIQIAFATILYNDARISRYIHLTVIRTGNSPML